MNSVLLYRGLYASAGDAQNLSSLGEEGRESRVLARERRFQLCELSVPRGALQRRSVEVAGAGAELCERTLSRLLLLQQHLHIIQQRYHLLELLLAARDDGAVGPDARRDQLVVLELPAHMAHYQHDIRQPLPRSTLLERHTRRSTEVLGRQRLQLRDLDAQRDQLEQDRVPEPVGVLGHDHILRELPALLHQHPSGLREPTRVHELFCKLVRDLQRRRSGRSNGRGRHRAAHRRPGALCAHCSDSITDHLCLLLMLCPLLPASPARNVPNFADDVIFI
ncbi:hypothetical protein DAKH74_045800 [Maudiozyma humilis]|uniref:Uncharacterized protein n=1 Tax=Maudiozyma humilis TaxID=51915 RepID=A0AAV5S5G2_MAUHU|nr:hypothetical protein DAKH74_045800 [Kazachstania humilis]